MDNSPSPDNSPALATIPLLLLALAHMLVHVLTNGNYGMFRDEFYYIACSDHLSWGYVDHPPLSIFLLKISRLIFGDSVQAIRLLATLSGGILVFMTGVLAREMGGKRYAQILASTCMLISVQHLGLTGFYSMNIFDLIFWIVGFYLIIKLIKTGNEKLWMLIGLVIGLGLMNKISMMFFGFSLAVAMLFTPLRKYYLSKYMYIGGIIAFLIFLPHLIWQVANEWPTVEFIANAKQYKISHMTQFQFFLEQVMTNHPFNFPIWVAGLGFLLFSKTLKPYRILGLLFIITYIVLAAQQSKPYYLAPAFPVILAAGGVVIDQIIQRIGWNRIRNALIVVLILGGAVLAPVAVPLLSVESLIKYQQELHFEADTGEVYDSGLLPQYFADRFGWEGMTKTVAVVYNDLTSEEKAACVIITSNYGEAGAISYYGKQYDLPLVISGHNSYHLWGHGENPPEVVITVGFSVEHLTGLFENLHSAANIVSKYSMPFESNMVIYVCRGLKLDIETTLKEVKRYI